MPEGTGRRHAFEVGVTIPHFGASVSREGILGTVQLAEDLGFHAAWFSDHLVIPVSIESSYPYQIGSGFSLTHEAAWTECWTTMSFAAGRTERIMLGTSVLVVPYRHPVLLGAQVSALQFLSGGRVILGVGAGWMAEEFAAVGVPFSERGGRLDEGLEVVRSMCSSSPAEFHGRYCDMPPAGTEPLPVSPPEIWVGGDTDVALRRAARFDGWLSYHASVDSVLAAKDRLPDNVKISVRTGVNPDALGPSLQKLDRLRRAGVDHLAVQVCADVATVEKTWRQLAGSLLG